MLAEKVLKGVQNFASCHKDVLANIASDQGPVVKMNQRGCFCRSDDSVPELMLAQEVHRGRLQLSVQETKTFTSERAAGYAQGAATGAALRKTNSTRIDGRHSCAATCRATSTWTSCEGPPAH